MGARIGQEISLALETKPERRCDDCVAHNRHVMQGVVEAQRESNDQKGGACLDCVGRAVQMIGAKGTIDRRFGQCTALDLETIRVVPGRFVNQHMPAHYEK